jgi:glycosyltransferase involved in cell wall biosynthesis
LEIGVFHPALDMYGGAEVVAVTIANALAQNGYNTILFMNKLIDQKKIQEMLGEPLSPSIKVIVNPTFLKPRGNFHLYESAFRSFAFKSRCDILIDTYSCYIFPWIDVSYMHFPYLNHYEFRQKFPYFKPPRLRHVLTIPHAVFEKNLENYDGKLILANSYFTAKAIKESLGAESKVLYPPIPYALCKKHTMILKAPREPLVVTVARFGQGKGVELVPEIASLTDNNIRFLIIGLLHDLNVFQAVKRRISELKLEGRVTLITDASCEKIKESLSKAKVYLHTTKMEHFGISIVEAMSMGCLPVVHNSGGALEFVPDQYKI